MKLKICIPINYCEAAKEAIADILRVLEKDALVGHIDETAINLLGASYDTFFKAKQLVDKDGMMIYDKKKNPMRANPSVKIMNDAATKIIRLLKEFNMTPLSRQKAGKEFEDKKLSPFEKFVGKKVESR